MGPMRVPSYRQRKSTDLVQHALPHATLTSLGGDALKLDAIPALATADSFYVVVESPRGSVLKLKYEPRLNAMSVSRPLLLGLAYPFDWGFIPSTQAADGDPLDTMLLWDVASYPGVVIECRAVAVLQVEQNLVDHDSSRRIRNDRIMAMPESARREHSLRDLKDLPERLKRELEQFACVAVALEGKDIRVVGWQDSAAALGMIRSAARVK
jgi:inorganic pyrophosphatase